MKHDSPLCGTSLLDREESFLYPVRKQAMRVGRIDVHAPGSRESGGVEGNGYAERHTRRGGTAGCAGRIYRTHAG